VNVGCRAGRVELGCAIPRAAGIPLGMVLNGAMEMELSARGRVLGSTSSSFLHLRQGYFEFPSFIAGQTEAQRAEASHPRSCN
jgi:hypothetical protein